MAERREQELKRRNALIKGIAQSLDKKEVLNSIIDHLCAIMKAERGRLSSRWMMSGRMLRSVYQR